MTVRHSWPILIVLLALSAFGAAVQPARAQQASCTFAMTGVAFGSIDVLPGAAFSTNATLTIRCTGLPTGQSAEYVCVTLPTPRAMQGPASSTLAYDILGPPPANTSWSNTTPIVVPAAQGAASATVNVTATLFGNQAAAPPGNYTQTINATVEYGFPGCALGQSDNGAFAFQVSATVLKSCNVAAANLDFGSAGDLSAAIDGQSQLSIQCSNGTGYSIALNGGLAGAADPTQRKMSAGTQTITYGLYQNLAHTSAWGSTPGVNVVNGAGASTTQVYSVYGRIPVQATPAAGTYTDTIVVSVAY